MDCSGSAWNARRPGKRSMEKIQLHPELTQEDIKTAISRYHYQDTDLPLFFQVYAEVRENLEPEGSFVYSGPEGERIGKEAGLPGPGDKVVPVCKDTLLPGPEDKAAPVCKDILLSSGKQGFCQVIATLGSGPDRLQDGYAAKGMLTESYMAECICMELLRKACGELNEKIREKYGLFVEKMLFPGSELPLEAMEGIFAQAGQTAVSYNPCFVLSPKKSVVYLAQLGNRACGEPCDSCSNKGCPNRKTALCEKEAAALPL